MATLVLNGTSYTGLPNGTGAASAWQPTAYKPIAERQVVILPAVNGTRNRVERSTTKYRWEIGWEKTNLATMQTLQTLALVATTWSMTAFDGVVYTVQTEEPLDIEWSHNSPSGATYWNVALKIWQV